MSTIRLVPKTNTELDPSREDKILAALARATATVKEQVEAGVPPAGVMVILWDEYPDGSAEESWVIAGLNQIEVVGILSKTIHDIQTYSMQGSDGDDAA